MNHWSWACEVLDAYIINRLAITSLASVQNFEVMYGKSNVMGNS
jgi:hypothetical protein